jgi:hypothetical protein
MLQHSVDSTNPLANTTRSPTRNPIRSYSRQRRSGSSRDVNGTIMTLRHRPKTYFKLESSNMRNGVKQRDTTAPSTARAIDGSSRSTESSATPTTALRRSQRSGNTAHETTSAIIAPTLDIGSKVSTEETVPILATPRRRSHRTLTGKAPLSNGVINPTAHQHSTLSSTMKHDPMMQKIEIPTITAAVTDRERRMIMENRILLRSLESYGPNYDFIHNTVFPIYFEREATISACDVSPHDRQLLEKRCDKLLRKSERINAQREATIQHYFKSWIVPKIAQPIQQRVRCNNVIIRAIPSLEVPSKTETGTITTRFGRTSKCPITAIS